MGWYDWKFWRVAYSRHATRGLRTQNHEGHWYCIGFKIYIRYTSTPYSPMQGVRDMR